MGSWIWRWRRCTHWIWRWGAAAATFSRFDYSITIVVDILICLAVCALIWPMWAGQELHQLTVRNMEKLAADVEGCVEDYFAEGDAEASKGGAQARAMLEGYKCVPEVACLEFWPGGSPRTVAEICGVVAQESMASEHGIRLWRSQGSTTSSSMLTCSSPEPSPGSTPSSSMLTMSSSSSGSWSCLEVLLSGDGLLVPVRCWAAACEVLELQALLPPTASSVVAWSCKCLRLELQLLGSGAGTICLEVHVLEVGAASTGCSGAASIGGSRAGTVTTAVTGTAAVPGGGGTCSGVATVWRGAPILELFLRGGGGACCCLQVDLLAGLLPYGAPCCLQVDLLAGLLPYGAPVPAAWRWISLSDLQMSWVDLGAEVGAGGGGGGGRRRWGSRSRERTERWGSRSRGRRRKRFKL